MKKTKSYDQAFKEQAVKLSYERKNILTVAREMGVSYTTIRRWRKEYEDSLDKNDAVELSENENSAIAALAFWWWMCLI